MTTKLRTKLILSHVGLTLLAFALTFMLAIVPVRNAQQQDLEDRLEDGAQSLARQVSLYTQFSNTSIVDQIAQDPTTTAIVLRLAADWTSARVLLVSPDGTVLVDTASDGSLEGQQIPQIEEGISHLNSQISGQLLAGIEDSTRLAQQTRSVQIENVDGELATVATTLLNVTQDDDQIYLVAMAPVPRFPTIDSFVGPLLVAAGIALLISLGLAALIARSISKPVMSLTQTATEISEGKLEMRAEQATGEFGLLVAAFNGMLDRLETVDRSQRRLLANIAHELRTPLTSIQGYAQAMRDGLFTSTEAHDEAMEVIVVESARMEELVNQVLQLSRLESGERPLNIEMLEVDVLLHDVVRRFRASAETSGIHLSSDAPDDLQFPGDRELLLQALGNLVTNALRHTPDGGFVHLRGYTETQAEGELGGAVCIEVADDGAGIRSDQLERIFERFQRGGDGPDADGTGFGLGLAIVREVITKHHGEITVESVVDHGSRFVIRLPASAGAPLSALEQQGS